MAESNIIQMHDYAGNNQYPVTLASLVYDEDGETVSKKLALLLDWFEWGDDAHSSVKTKYHFWSEKQLSAGGIGEEGGSGEGGIGTITGIKVNGEVWNEPDEFGVLTIPDYPTSLEWTNINGKPTHLSQFTDDVVAGHYLPLTGGTIKSASHIPLLIETTSDTNYATIRFVTLSTQRTLGIKGDGTLFVTNAGSWDAEYPLLHSGNVGEYAARSYSDVGANNVTGNALGHSYATAEHGGRYAGGFISFGVSSYGCQLQGDANGNGLVFRGYSPSGFTPWKTIAFTDSDITGNAATATNADTLDGYHADIMVKSHIANTDNFTKFTNRAFFQTSYVSGQGDFCSLVIPTWIGNTESGYYTTELRFDNGSKNPKIRVTDPNGTSDWYILARTVDNVASATKLATPRTIWGQSFDGTGNVTTPPTMPYVYFANQHSEDRIGYIGKGVSNENTIYIAGLKDDARIYLFTGAGDAAHSIIFNSTGNVLLGTVVDEGYKLDVRGSTHLDAYDGVSYVHLGPLAFGTKIQAKGDGNTSFQSQRFDDTTVYYNIILQELGGNVGIGTSSPDEMLHVAGNIRLKNASAYGCFLKFGDYNYCYLHEDSDDHLKIYADKGILLSTDVNYGVTIDQSLTIGSAVLTWDSVNNALKIEGNVYTTGQLSAGGVGTEVQKVFDINAESNATTANQSYTATLTHNLNTYDLAVVVYEVEEITQSDGTTEKLTQVLADVTLTDENKVTVYFASRKINRKYRIVIIG